MRNLIYQNANLLKKNILLSLALVCSLNITYGQWTVKSLSVTQEDLQNMYFVDASTGWAVGDNGLILKNYRWWKQLEYSNFYY